MDSWIEGMARLRAEFVERGAAELDRVDQLLGRLREGPGDFAGLDELLRLYHGFAGAGGTFGLPAVSVAGAEGEQIATRLAAAGAPPDGADRARLAAVAAALRRAFDEPPEPRPRRAPAKPVATAPPPAAAGRRRDILVASGREETRRTLVPLLGLGDFAVRLAGSRAEADVELDAALPEVLIADDELPDGSGLAVVAALRARPRGNGPAVFVLGSRGAAHEPALALSKGADRIFPWPIAWGEMARELATAGALRAGAAAAP
jgi:CheY-like chemotaxis protein